MKKDFLWMLGILIVMTGISVQAQDISVNRDSVTTNGSVNQIVVVNPAPATRVFRNGTSRTTMPSVVNNYYDRHCSIASCDRRGPVDPANGFIVAPVTNEKFDYQDIWLIVLTTLFAIGIGIFIGYLIWNRRGSSRPVIVHSHGGQSSSSSSSSSCCGHQTSSLGKAPTPAPSPAPVATTVAPAPPVATAVEQEKKTEEKKS